MQEIISYIIRFLSGNFLSDKQIHLIGYTSEEKEFSKYKLVIRQSSFFDKTVFKKAESLPQLPLQEWENIPLLFGKPTVETFGETTVLHADIIASSFFLLSRYEEIVRCDVRDKHGRFTGKESLPYRAGFLQRPIVDEYGKAFRKLLKTIGFEINEPEEKINRIYLTHDVDQLAHYRSVRGLASAFLHAREIPTALKTYFGKIENDPWFSFPWLFKLNSSLKNTNCETIAFIKTKGDNSPEDKTNYGFYSKDFKHLLQLCNEYDVKIGLHASYAAGENPLLIEKEKQQIKSAVNKKITYNRHHYLRIKEPEDMDALVHAGITDDFTLGYADIAGFRLGTSRCVKWINPATLQLTPLNLHPLTVMDRTLDDKRYMNLSEDEAFEVCKKIIDETKKHNGDLTLLWHNTNIYDYQSFRKSYQKKLYEKVITYIRKVE